jgi:hypothetical protein
VTKAIASVEPPGDIDNDSATNLYKERRLWWPLIKLGKGLPQSHFAREVLHVKRDEWRIGRCIRVGDSVEEAEIDSRTNWRHRGSGRLSAGYPRRVATPLARRRAAGPKVCQLLDGGGSETAPLVKYTFEPAAAHG